MKWLHFIFLGAILHDSTASQPPNIDLYHEVLNWDCYGSDLGRIENTDASTCADLCMAESTCVGFVVDERLDEGSHDCYPKTACVTFQNLEGVHSYIFRTSDLSKYEVYNNKDCFSNDLPSVEGIEMDECDRICMAYDNCVAITYTTSNKKCHPKHACPSHVDLSNAVSYRLKSYLSNLPKYDVKKDQTSPGNEIALHLHTRPEVCDILCRETEGCVCFTYDGLINSCSLKDQCDTITDKQLSQTYSLQKQVCEMVPGGSCVAQFDYDGGSYEGCVVTVDPQGETPWCSHVTDSSKVADVTSNCSRDCIESPHASQYGSLISWESFDETAQTDTATEYTMVYADRIGQSGLITTLNLVIGDVGRDVGIGVYRESGDADCQFILVRQILLHQHPDYKHYLNRKGAVKIPLNPEDYIRVTPGLHIGYYWNNQGTFYLTNDASDYGFDLCAFSSKLFSPYVDEATGSLDFKRHYSFNVVIESSGTDLNAVLNGAMFHDVTIGDTSYSRKTNNVYATDGDYNTCQDLPGNTIAVDFVHVVSVTQVIIHGDSNYDVTVKAHIEDGAEEITCGSGSLQNGFVVINCNNGTRGRYVEVTVDNQNSGIRICEIETKLGNLFETCIGDECYFVTSQQTNSPGLAQEECRRQYASASLFEPRDADHWNQVGDWYKTLFLSGIDDWGEKYDNHDCSINTDISSVLVDSPEACFQACFAERECVAFSYTTLFETNCHLKHTCDDLAPNGESDGSVTVYTRNDNLQYNSVVGFAFWPSDDLWHYTSSGEHTANIPKKDDHPSNHNYALMDAETGLYTSEQSVKPHYVLCTVPKSTFESSWTMVLRAASGTDLNVNTLQSDTSPKPDIDEAHPASLTSLSKIDTDEFRSPILQCVDWAASVLEVKLSFYKNEVEVAYVLFSPGSSFEDWFSTDNLKGSSYSDLPSELTEDISVTGGLKDEAKGLYSIQAFQLGCEDMCSAYECKTRSVPTWMRILDTDHQSECDDDSTGPRFQYSGQTGYSEDLMEADVAAISVRLDVSELGGSCMDTCHGKDDGNYQSCLGCNMYIICTAQVLVYGTCRSGYKFDSDARICNETSSTCTGDSASKSCETGCPTENPCENGGTCSEQTGQTDGWLCDCATGYEGAYCQDDIDYCVDKTCSSKGTCQDGLSSYTCDCQPGYEGDDCETQNYCYDVDCGENGDCVREESDFTCDCTTGFTGERCEVENQCVTNSIDCNGNGVCSNTESGAGWECTCEDSHIGEECEVPNPCQDDPCDSDEDSLCEVTADQTGYYCDCGAYIGQHCNLTNPCTNDPCQHGDCEITENYQFRCECEEHYSGDLCDTSPCDSEPKCENGGTCNVDLNEQTGYKCECVSPYTGDQCDVSPCEPNPCENSGVCTVNLTSYNCMCTWPHDGDHCELNLNDDINPNDNGASYMSRMPVLLTVCVTLIAVINSN